MRGDLRTTYNECKSENPGQGPIVIALAVLRKDDQCGAKFGTDANGARAFNVWVQHNPQKPVVGPCVAEVLKAQRRKPISDKRREDAWHYWHEIVEFPL